MRPISLAAILASLAALSACASDAPYQSETTAPTVSYSYTSDDDEDVVDERADVYCADEYGLDAVRIDRVSDGDGYRATYACR